MAAVFRSRSSRPPTRVQHPSLAPGQMASMFKAHPGLCLDLSLVPVNGSPTEGTVVPELGFLATVTGLSNASSSVVHPNVGPWAEATLSKYMDDVRRHAESSKHDDSGLSPTSGGICPKHLATMHSLLAFDVSIDPDHSTNPDFHSVLAPSQAGMGYRPRVMVCSNQEFGRLHTGRGSLVIANPSIASYDPKKHRCEYTINTGSRFVNEIDCSSQAILAGTSTRYPSLAYKIERGEAGLCITPMPGLFGSSKDFDCTTFDTDKGGRRYLAREDDPREELENTRSVYQSLMQDQFTKKGLNPSVKTDLEQAARKVQSYTTSVNGEDYQPFKHLRVVCQKPQPSGSRALWDTVRSKARSRKAESSRSRSSTYGKGGYSLLEGAEKKTQ